jgi:hypothetical protein
MDVNFCEDANLATSGNTAENLAALKRLTSTMIRIDLGGTRGTAQRKRQDEAQLVTYLKLSVCKVGLLMNFNVKILKQGLRRIIV